MSSKKVAGTIILTLKDDSKKLLVQQVDQTLAFVTTKLEGDVTGLASLLSYFKQNVGLDVTAIQLVELSNANTKGEAIPFFVFEMDEKDTQADLPQDYTWEAPKNVQFLLSSYDMNGMPMF